LGEILVISQTHIEELPVFKVYGEGVMGDFLDVEGVVGFVDPYVVMSHGVTSKVCSDRHGRRQPIDSRKVGCQVVPGASQAQPQRAVLSHG